MLNKVRPQSGVGRTIFDLGLTALAAMALAIGAGLRREASTRFQGSMANTLVPHQRVLFDRLVSRFRPVERGDIIVFRCAALGNEVLVKRVVGLPGDLLALRNGRLSSTACRQATPLSTRSTASRTDSARQYLHRKMSPGGALVAGSAISRAHQPVLHDRRQPYRIRRQPLLGTVPRSASSVRRSSPIGPLGVSGVSEQEVRFGRDASSTSASRRRRRPVRREPEAAHVRG